VSEEKPEQTESHSSIPMSEPVKRSRFGPFSDIVQRYSETSPELQTIDPERYPELIAAICPNGVPTPQVEGHPLKWHRGISSLCNPHAEGVMGNVAAKHSEVLTEMYQRWSDLEGTEIGAPMYDGIHRHEAAHTRGAFLNPSLAITNREDLSDTYINAVLRPYAQAVIECRVVLWRHLRSGHECGAWVGFQNTDMGTYSPLPPGAGFGPGRNYTINRTAYLQGFGYPDNEIGHENYPDLPPYPGQDHWMFIGADQLQNVLPPKPDTPRSSQEVQLTPAEPTKPAMPQEHALPRRGFARKDKEFVLKGLDLFLSGQTLSANETAKYLVEHHGEDIPGNSHEAKVHRLRKAISETLKGTGFFAGDPEVSKTLQKYPN